MKVYMMIRRNKTSILIDIEDSKTVLDLKELIDDILTLPPSRQQLYYNGMIMDDNNFLSDCGLDTTNANVIHSTTIDLALKNDDGKVEKLDIIPYSEPIERPL